MEFTELTRVNDGNSEVKATVQRRIEPGPGYRRRQAEADAS